MLLFNLLVYFAVFSVLLLFCWKGLLEYITLGLGLSVLLCAYCFTNINLSSNASKKKSKGY